MRRAARKDANHKAISAALSAVGAFVVDLSGAGIAGLPDLLIAHRGVWTMADCKDLSGWYGRQGLQDEQRTFAERAAACGVEVRVFTSADDALRQLGVME